MSNTTIVVGNLAQDPELQYTPQGKAMVKFSIADTPRNFDKASGQWVDGETDWVRVIAWEGLAENIAASLRKGNQVIVMGSTRVRAYTDAKTNEPKTIRELRADTVGPSLQFATAVVTRSNRSASHTQTPASAPAAPTYTDDTPF